MSVGEDLSRDERLPLRWSVIVAVAVGLGVGAGMIGGPIVGIGVGIAAMGTLAKIVGR